jgi:tRNA-specific 2-thiouridylase
MKSQAIIGLNKATKKSTSVNNSSKGKVFVGLSGGVDSSVSAALLKKAGYDVTGVFIKVWQPDWLECTWKEERRDAMRVAAHLDIPFLTLDLEKEYKRDVVDYMLAEYKAGRTPNPDVMCNKAVKFGAFYEWAMAQGADFVATGHYAEIKHEIRNSKSETRNPKQIQNYNSKNKGQLLDSSYLILHTSYDSNKDQSYFLWNLRTDQLPHILFPVGHLTKPEVRKLADTFKLPTAMKKDSQGICFIGMVDMKTFLSHYIESKEGSVLNEAGKVIGTHSGAVFFTIGERHGFTITEKGSYDGAYYVVSKDVEKNTITVKMHESAATLHTSYLMSHSSNPIPHTTLSSTNWISGAPILGKKYSARGRYRQELFEVIFEKLDEMDSTAVVKIETGHETITPGQSLVIYDGEVCLGGGVIE